VADARHGSTVAAVSRREFMAAGALAGVWSLAGCKSLPHRARQWEPQVVVVGAGLAGLTAAYRLRLAGVPTLVIDANDKVGGRVRTIRGTFQNGQVAELGGELIDSGHTRVRALLDELALPLDDLADADAGLTPEIYCVGHDRYSEADVADAFRAISARYQSDAQALGTEAITYKTPGSAEALDRMSMADWLDQSGAPLWFQAILAAAFTAEYGLDIGEQSSLNLLTRLSARTDATPGLGLGDQRYRVRGGTSTLIDALAGAAERIDTSTVLEGIRERADGQIELDVKRGSATTVAAPHVIVTVPFSVLRGVKIGSELPPAKRKAIDRLGYGTSVKVVSGFDDRLWRTKYKSTGSVVCDEWHAVWDASRGQGGKTGILAGVLGGREGATVSGLAAGELSQHLVSRLEPLFHGIADTREAGYDASFDWVGSEWSKGSHSTYRPGQWTTIRGAEGERVKNLHFAGEHCSLHAQGTMEGAIASGDAAASEVLADMGITPPAPTPKAQKEHSRKRGLFPWLRG
jgi:monoamine oxidase